VHGLLLEAVGRFATLPADLHRELDAGFGALRRQLP
jgi:hypothetical protein